MSIIKVKGAIVSNDSKWIYDWFDMESTSPKDVEKELQNYNGEEIEVHINSGGGDVYAGSEIYTLLKDYKGQVKVKILGFAASAASVVAMSGDKILISPTGQFMIHNVSTMYFSGDHRAFEHEAEVLKSHNQSIANAYMLRTGLSKEELLNLMNNETYFDAKKAMEYKFVDEIMFDESNKLVASVSSNMIPNEVINKIRNLLNNSNDADDKKSKLIANIKVDSVEIIEKIKEHISKNNIDDKKSIEIEKTKSKLNLLKLMEVKL